ncbi:potassium-transporting ATPase subunit C [Salmonella enterica]|nr:potassium-transporting ATPase subunit C [Salmonella enterica]
MIGLRPAFSTMLFLLLLTGGVYPLLTTALGQWWFPWQANGSLIHKDNVIRGSALIGQSFTAAGYFHGRPSATADTPYNPLASGGSNLAASNPELDNNLTPGAAAWQIPRVAAARQLPVEQVAQLVAEYTHRPLARFLGQPVVNIVELNLALDALQGHRAK